MLFTVDSLHSSAVRHGLRFFQVMSLSPAPLSLLIKAAPILTEEMYGDIQPAAWELLLSVDEHMAGAAGRRTKPLSTATLAAQLTVDHRALQDNFVVEESEHHQGFLGGGLVFIDLHVFLCSVQKRWSEGSGRHSLRP